MSQVMRKLMWLSALIVVALPQTVHARDVKHCGITIGPGKTGKLVRDVQCGSRCNDDLTECHLETMILESNATLDLNGFDVNGGLRIICAAGTRSTCTIKGPGNFFAAQGIVITPNDRDIVLKDLVIDQLGLSFVTGGSFVASNVVIRSSTGVIMRALAGVRVKNSRLDCLHCSLESWRSVYLDGVDSSAGVSAVGTVRAKDVTIHDSYLDGKNLLLTRVQILPAVFSPSEVFEVNVSATRRLALRDSAVGRVQSGLKPDLIRSTCLESRQLPLTTESWNVCQFD